MRSSHRRTTRPRDLRENVWIYWHSEVSSMPSWCRHNIIDWVRLLGPSWTIHALSSLSESPNYALKWIYADLLPEAFVKGTMDGPYVGPHRADFLRGAAIWDPVSDCGAVDVSAGYGEPFIAAKKKDWFIKRCYSGISLGSLVSFVKNIRLEDSAARGVKWDFCVGPLTVLGYIGQVLSFSRVGWLQEPGDGGFDGVEYYMTKVPLSNALTGDWSAEPVLGFKGEDFFHALATRRDVDPESEEYKLAYQCVWKISTSAKENEGKRVEEGTFAELLRYGSPVRPEEVCIIRKGLLEA
ncbi:hypothetical protein GQ43DRAFT_457119 [Delitschia confertaspora ATCC 74209]|uniref:Capsule polysaccharide biosynthesis protein n=1 Tax=Delitschia confertaspora ATCC 74209 TaxID=1513339 RepID=A0A9P4JHH1_9PLEO|nr:hypothetical protein GQ43DRAFT_457119 [Delitschia confertaspora ATCC 74209]